MAWDARWGLKRHKSEPARSVAHRLNGLGCPLGIETNFCSFNGNDSRSMAKWLGMPVGDSCEKCLEDEQRGKKAAQKHPQRGAGVNKEAGEQVSDTLRQAPPVVEPVR